REHLAHVQGVGGAVDPLAAFARQAVDRGNGRQLPDDEQQGEQEEPGENELQAGRRPVESHARGSLGGPPPMLTSARVALPAKVLGAWASPWANPRRPSPRRRSRDGRRGPPSLGFAGRPLPAGP